MYVCMCVYGGGIFILQEEKKQQVHDSGYDSLVMRTLICFPLSFTNGSLVIWLTNTSRSELRKSVVSNVYRTWT